MSKLYVFAIGGTGSRVLRSLTMLAAAGVNMGTNEIVPIIIDADQNNGDLTRTANLINSYSSIRDGINFEVNSGNTFLRTEIHNPIVLTIEGTAQKFKEFICYGQSYRDEEATIVKQGMAMINMLFSEANLDADMDVGFKGNPNMGCVVLNQIASTNEFNAFANSFQQDDKIFIISSIFGGTGASGFPLLLKTLRDRNAKFPNAALIKEAKMGAITTLPYFKVEHVDGKDIDSSSFISKARSALAYYEDNIIGLVNAMYYLADDVNNTYEYHEGDNEQKNPAHIIEFLAATAVIDFMGKEFSEKVKTEHYEYGVEDLPDDGVVSFRNFGEVTQGLLMKPMTQLALMVNCFKENTQQYKLITSDKFAANKKICATGNFYQTDYFNKLRRFLESYKEWLTELKENKRPLYLFDLDCARPFELVNGCEPKRGGWFSRKDYSAFYHALNEASQRVRGNESSSLFMEIFSKATDKLTQDKLNMKSVCHK